MHPAADGAGAGLAANGKGVCRHSGCAGGVPTGGADTRGVRGGETRAEGRAAVLLFPRHLQERAANQCRGGAQRAVHLRHRPHSESAGMVGGHRTAMQGVRHRTGAHHSQRRGLPTGVLHAEGHVAASGAGVDGAAGGRQGVRYLGERPLAMLVRSAPRVCAFPG